MPFYHLRTFMPPAVSKTITVRREALPTHASVYGGVTSVCYDCK